MGCCLCCESPKPEENADENAPLIPNVLATHIPQSAGKGDIPGVAHSHARGAEYDILNKILTEIAQNIIDIASLESHPLDQQEYQDRMKHYNHKLVSSGLLQRSSYATRLPYGVDNVHSALSVPTLSVEDAIVVSKSIALSMQDIKVAHAEDLVTTFDT